jgi:hypothetical protein
VRSAPALPHESTPAARNLISLATLSPVCLALRRPRQSITMAGVGGFFRNAGRQSMDFLRSAFSMASQNVNRGECARALPGLLVTACLQTRRLLRLRA